MSTPEVAPVEAIRTQFPALARSVGGVPAAYFDGPGGTQVPGAVAEAVTDYLLHHNANTHWAYPTSVETDAALGAARQILADYLEGAPGEIVFGANMTSLTFHLGRALGRTWGPGDEIVVTELDHHANVDTWRALERDRGVTVRSVPMRTEDGTLDLAALEHAVTDRTRLVAIGAASNALGTVSDLAPAVAAARAHGALVFVDAVHYAAHLPPDAAAWGCDFVACSPYKFYGPHVGVLWGRRAVLESLDVPRLQPADDRPPECLETGTLSHEGIVGAAAAVEFLASLSGTKGSRRDRLVRTAEALHARGRVLIERLWSGLAALPGVRLYGPAPDRPRTPTLAFTVTGHTSRQVAEHLATRAVFVSDGDFYASTVVRRLGVEGLVRAGCAAYTTAEEVDRLVEGVAELTGPTPTR